MTLKWIAERLCMVTATHSRGQPIAWDSAKKNLYLVKCSVFDIARWNGPRWSGTGPMRGDVERVRRLFS